MSSCRARHVVCRRGARLRYAQRSYAAEICRCRRADGEEARARHAHAAARHATRWRAPRYRRPPDASRERYTAVFLLLYARCLRGAALRRAMPRYAMQPP